MHGEVRIGRWRAARTEFKGLAATEILHQAHRHQLLRQSVLVREAGPNLNGFIHNDIGGTRGCAATDPGHGTFLPLSAMASCISTGYAMAAFSQKRFAELLHFNHDIVFPSPILTKTDDEAVHGGEIRRVDAVPPAAPARKQRNHRHLEKVAPRRVARPGIFDRLSGFTH